MCAIVLLRRSRRGGSHVSMSAVKQWKLTGLRHQSFKNPLALTSVRCLSVEGLIDLGDIFPILWKCKTLNNGFRCNRPVFGAGSHRSLIYSLFHTTGRKLSHSTGLACFSHVQSYLRKSQCLRGRPPRYHRPLATTVASCPNPRPAV